MDGQERLATTFEAHRGYLRAVAFRMLGSSNDVDDAVQETWLRLSRTDVSAVESLRAWLRTVISRICYDILRSRASSREELVGQQVPEMVPDFDHGIDPEKEAVLVDSVSRALLVVLDALRPAERVAFVLHDMFAVPFDQIAPIVERSTVASKKLASRARRKVQGTSPVPEEDIDGLRRVVDAFLAASRTGDLAGLLAVLAPDVVREADGAALALGVARQVRGAHAVAEETVLLRRFAQYAEPAMVNGSVGVVVAPYGRLLLALEITVEGDRVTRYAVVADPARLDIAVLDRVAPDAA
jgi:RNA polymerase sigma factor (sigma-70 family)